MNIKLSDVWNKIEHETRGVFKNYSRDTNQVVSGD